MGKYDISVCQPALRPSYWKNFYDSISGACKKYSWELVLIAPYDPPLKVAGQSNVKFIKEYCTSTKAAMIGALQCEGDLMVMLCDDGIAFSDSLDLAADLYHTINQPKDVIVLRYREGQNFKGRTLPMEYWYSRHHGKALRGVPNIHHDWMHMMQYLMSLQYFKDIGGYDCRFEHMAFAGHDLAYRIQRDGGKCHPSPSEVMCADWFPGSVKDHGPVAESHEQHDFPLFRSIQTDPGVHARTKIDFDNWKQAPAVWTRRWPKGAPS